MYGFSEGKPPFLAPNSVVSEIVSVSSRKVDTYEKCLAKLEKSIFLARAK